MTDAPMCVCGQQLGLSAEQEIRTRLAAVCLPVVAGDYALVDRDEQDRVVRDAVYMAAVLVPWVATGEQPATATGHPAALNDLLEAVIAWRQARHTKDAGIAAEALVEAVDAPALADVLAAYIRDGLTEPTTVDEPESPS